MCTLVRGSYVPEFGYARMPLLPVKRDDEVLVVCTTNVPNVLQSALACALLWIHQYKDNTDKVLDYCGGRDCNVLFTTPDPLGQSPLQKPKTRPVVANSDIHRN